MNIQRKISAYHFRMQSELTLFSIDDYININYYNNNNISLIKICEIQYKYCTF